MPERFDLERRAEELFTTQSENSTYRQNFWESRALQLARELAEAIAAECDRAERRPTQFNSFVQGAAACADIARSFVRPRSREDIYEQALRLIANGPDTAMQEVAARALDEGAKERQP